MKPETTTKQDEGWPRVLRISESDEFKQCVAVARLAVKLCEIAMARPKMPLEKQNADPEKFLARAWELITNAREYVLQPMTDVEYLVQHEGKKGLTKVLERRDRASRVPFEKLCDARRNEGDTEMIHGVSWKVYCSERGFDKLFWRYWQDIGKKWKRGDPHIGTILELDNKGHQRRINFYSDAKRKRIAALWKRWPQKTANRWQRDGKRLLDSWKQDGLAPNDFLALAKFRKVHDKRSANLKSRPRKASGEKR